MTRGEDGLARSNGSAAGDQFLAAYDRACREQRMRDKVWTRSMIAAGVTIVTPDDGWVNRRDHWVSPPWYARYNAGAAVGGLIALGEPRKWRMVRVIRTEISQLSGMPRYHFDPLSVMEGKQG